MSGFGGFTPAQRSFLTGQRLGRLATVSPDGVVGNAPVAFFLHADDTIVIGGMRMGTTKKFRNVEAGSRFAFTVDDLAPGYGWNPHYLELRGTADAQRDVEPPAAGWSREVLVLRPDWIRDFGLPEV